MPAGGMRGTPCHARSASAGLHGQSWRMGGRSPHGFRTCHQVGLRRTSGGLASLRLLLLKTPCLGFCGLPSLALYAIWSLDNPQGQRGCCPGESHLGHPGTSKTPSGPGRPDRPPRGHPKTPAKASQKNWVLFSETENGSQGKATETGCQRLLDEAHAVGEWGGGGRS